MKDEQLKNLLSILKSWRKFTAQTSTDYQDFGSFMDYLCDKYNVPEED